MIQARAAVGTKPALHRFRWAGLAGVHPRGAPRDTEMLLRDYRSHGERGAGLSLTFGAMACVHGYGRSRNLIPHRPTLASSLLRKIHAADLLLFRVAGKRGVRIAPGQGRREPGTLAEQTSAVHVPSV